MIETHCCLTCDICHGTHCLPAGIAVRDAIDWALRNGWSYSEMCGHVCRACNAGAPHPPERIGIAEDDHLAVLIPHQN